jgi:exopolyphosphatase/guanosine-5'-triphosphate,3'-diphosphate pyrophosphatase
MTTNARWEWRTFDDHHVEAEARIRTVVGEELTREEFYLISPWTDLNVRIRDGAIHVKSIVQTNAAGLEQWRPTVHAPFPISAATLGGLLSGWAVDLSPIAAEQKFSEIDLLSILGDIAPEIAIVPVRKRQRRGVLSGCLVELTEVDVEGQSLRSIAVEHEDATRVVALLEELGLDALDNVNDIAELRRVHGTEKPSAGQKDSVNRRGPVEAVPGPQQASGLQLSAT